MAVTEGGSVVHLAPMPSTICGEEVARPPGSHCGLAVVHWAVKAAPQGLRTQAVNTEAWLEESNREHSRVEAGTEPSPCPAPAWKSVWLEVHPQQEAGS